MSDYKILVGTELDTKGLNKQVKDYKGNVSIGVDPDGIKSGIDTALSGYKSPKPVEVQSTLNTQGITDAITKYSEKENRKKVKVGIDTEHLFDGVESIINDKRFKTPLKVNVDLVWAGVANQIANPDFGAGGKPVFRVDVDFDDNIIETKWNSFAQGESRKRKLTVPIQPTLTGADAAQFFADVEKTLGDYTAKTALKVHIKLNKNEINKKITEYNQSLAQNSGKRILFNAALRANAIEKAITDFKAKHPEKLNIPIDFKINSELEKNTEFETALKQKIASYENAPLDIPVKLKPASKGFKDQISKVYATVEATLTNPKAISEEINSHIKSPLPVSVKLVPAAKGFTSEITKTPVKVEAELAPEAINNAITNPPKNLSKIPIGVSLQPKDINDINKQVQQLQAFATEKLNVGVTLDESAINADIASFKPVSKIGIQPDLNLENVDEQISAYVPKNPIKVHLKIDDGNIDKNTGKATAQDPIHVNVQLDQKSINEEIKAFNPALNEKINVGVQLDFKSHKDEAGKEIQQGISQQIKQYQTKAKLKVGVELDNDDIEGQIKAIETGSPVKLGVELDMEPAKAEIEKLRNEFQKFGKIVIQFPNANGGAANGGGGTRGGFATGVNAPSSSVNDFKKFTASVNNAKNVVTAMKTTLDGLGVNLKDVGAKNATKDIQEMGIEVQKVVTTIKGNTLQMSVTGIQEAENGIKRIVTETRKYDNAITNAENINKRFTQTFETSADAAKKLEKEVNEAFTTIYNIKKKIGDLEVELIGAKAEKDLERVKAINAEIIRLKGNLKASDKKGVYSSKFTDQQNAGLTELDSQIEYQKAYVRSKLADAKNDLVQEIRFKIDTNDFEKDVSNIETKAKNLGNVSKELRNSITQLKSNKTRIGNALDNDDVDAAVKAYERYLKLLEAVNNQLGIRKNEKKFIDVDFSRLENLKSEIDSIKKKIENLDPKVNTEQLSALSNRLKDLEADYDDLYKKLQKDLSTSQMDELDNSTAKANAELEELRGKIADIKAKLANKINAKLVNSDSGLSQFDNEIDAVTTKYNRLANKNIPELQFAMNELSMAFGKVKDASKNGTPDELIQANKEYELALKAVKAQLDINTRAEKEVAAAQKLEDDRTAFQSKIDAWLTKNSAAAKRFGTQLLELRAQAENCDRVTLDHLEREFKQLDKEAEAAGLRMQTFGDRLKYQFQKYSSYLSVASVLMYTGQAIRSMFEQVKLIDSAMTELKKVTNETDESYNKFLSNAAQRAKELGTTIDGLVGSTADFARLGYGFEDAQELAEVANIYAVVGDEIESVEDATQSLISTLAAFKDEMNGMDNGDFAMSIVDKMNEVANNYAISSGGLGQALQRSASSMAAANNSLDETIAMITAANEIAQNPEKVGNAMKTISMRIRGAKTE